MADYQLTQPEEPCAVIRTEDGAHIPPDPANRDYAEYLQWKKDGGTPDPYVEPPPPEEAPPTPEQQVLFDHENRVRALEGQPPLSVEDFVTHTTQLGQVNPGPKTLTPRRHGPPVPKPTRKG